MIDDRDFYTSLDEQKIIDANSRIELNAGIPCEGTDHWCIARLALAPYNFWFIAMPKKEGWNGHTQEEMINGVVDVDIQEFNNNWVPNPFPPQKLSPS